MIDVDKNLSAVLDTAFIPHEDELVDDEEPVVVATAVATTETPTAENPELDEDFKLARDTHHELLAQGSEALDGILEVAKQSQHPRAYEVASGMMKNLSDMADKLLLLRQQRKELEKGSHATAGNMHIQKAVVFQGSTADLLKQIKAK